MRARESSQSTPSTGIRDGHAGEATLSRRSMLKRGATVGATMVWVTPVVQQLTMSHASADSPSSPSVQSDTVTRPQRPTEVAGASLARDVGGAGDSLPATGSELVGLGAAGAAAVVTGAAIVRAARTRTPSSPGPQDESS